MNEQLLSFIWQNQYFNKLDLCSSEGDVVEVIFPGILNHNQGPDFTSATVKVGENVWSGSIELHVLSSDWNLHGHEHDRNYANVVLHVVWENNYQVSNRFPVLELAPRVPLHLIKKYALWMKKKAFIPCSNDIKMIDNRIIDHWLTWVGGISMDERKQEVVEMIKSCHQDWEEAFWRLLAKNFGYRVNSEAFAQIAASIPVKILQRHHHCLPQLEALLFGQANLIGEVDAESYPMMLQKEYCFLQTKYKLRPIVNPVFFHRMRPGNFPTIRLAQLAALFHQTSPLFASILNIKHFGSLKMLLNVTANDYWHYHYTFGEESAYKIKSTGNQLINSIIINTVIPFLFVYGKINNIEEFSTRAVNWMSKMPSTSNSITLAFNELGVFCKNAGQSQGLMYNKKNYCNTLRCLDCGIGKYILKKSNL